MASSNKTTLLSLPTELQYTIYGYALQAPSPIELVGHSRGIVTAIEQGTYKHYHYQNRARLAKPHGIRSLSLLHTSRAVYAVAVKAVYEANTFHFKNESAIQVHRGIGLMLHPLIEWTYSIGMRAESLRNVTIELPGYVKLSPLVPFLSSISSSLDVLELLQLMWKVPACEVGFHLIPASPNPYQLVTVWNAANANVLLRALAKNEVLKKRCKAGFISSAVIANDGLTARVESTGTTSRRATKILSTYVLERYG